MKKFGTRYGWKLKTSQTMINHLDITGSDIDHRMVEIAKTNSDEAGLGDLIDFKQMQVRDLTTKKEYGTIVGNPPYGERLGEKDVVEQMYKEMGQTFAKLDTWSIYIITSHPDFERLYGKPATKKRKLFNGFIRTDYYQYWGKRPPKRCRCTKGLSSEKILGNLLS